MLETWELQLEAEEGQVVGILDSLGHSQRLRLLHENMFRQC